MPKLKVLSGKDIIKIFEKLGFIIAGQKGSHIKLKRIINKLWPSQIIPNWIKEQSKQYSTKRRAMCRKTICKNIFIPNNPTKNGTLICVPFFCFAAKMLKLRSGARNPSGSPRRETCATPQFKHPKKLDKNPARTNFVKIKFSSPATLRLPVHYTLRAKHPNHYNNWSC